jgi:hypothetical protein
MIMKRILFLFSMLIAMSSCRQDSAGGGSMLGGSTKKATGSARPALAAVPNRETSLLTKDFWVFEYYVIPGNQEKSFFNRGLWYKLQMDGTYAYGHWEELLGEGTWYMSEREGKPVLNVDAATDDAYDMNWELNLGTYEGFEASFVATPESPQPGTMTKVINLMSRPTKKQFGYE